MLQYRNYEISSKEQSKANPSNIINIIKIPKTL